MGHAFSNLLVHFVFSTKDRLPLITDDLKDRLHDYMGGIANHEIGRSIRIGGTEDHVHGLLVLRTNVSAADAMEKWKSLSSGWVNKLKDGVARPRFGWQAGYGAFTVSQSNVSQMVAYIDGQVKRHKKQSFQEEYLKILHRHGVEYDPNTVWD